jgi:hypothetical protein
MRRPPITAGHSQRWAHIATVLNNPLFLTLALVAIVLAYGVYMIVY